MKKHKHKKGDAPGMKGKRGRDEDGALREKRGDTKVGTIEKKYHVHFGVHSNMKLDTLLKRRKVFSMKKALAKKHKK